MINDNVTIKKIRIILTATVIMAFSLSLLIFYNAHSQVCTPKLGSDICPDNPDASTIPPKAGELNRWAHDDNNFILKYIDFYLNNVTVDNNSLGGWAVSRIIDDDGSEENSRIYLNCEANFGKCPNCVANPGLCPAGDLNNYKVSNNSGQLAGWAWSPFVGWINFCGGIIDSWWDNGISKWRCPVGGNGVAIDSDPSSPNAGIFSGKAWNNVIGSISFNRSDNPPFCNIPGDIDCDDFKVRTEWTQLRKYADLTSSVFWNSGVSGITGGAKINSIMWQGQKNGGDVMFQFASCDSSCNPNNINDWIFMGPDGTNTTWYINDSNNPKIIILNQHNNKEYFRYKVRVVSDQTNIYTPVVKDIIINWSP